MKAIRLFPIVLTLFLGAMVSSPVTAIPTLQLYIEGATYDPLTESWSIATDGSFILWVIGNVGQYGTIYDVRLAAAVRTDETGIITLTPTTATLGLLPAPGDPSVPPSPTPTSNFPSAPGQIPRLGDGRTLPKHDAYGPSVKFFEWRLGDFTLKDSPIGDFIGSFPTTFPSKGQINAYFVTVTGFSRVHFDAYNHVQGQKSGKFKSRFTPFSHDAVWTPEPAAGLLVLLGGLALTAFRKRLPKR